MNSKAFLCLSLSDIHCSLPWVAFDTNLEEISSAEAPKDSFILNASNYYLESVMQHYAEIIMKTNLCNVSAH